MDRIAIHHTLAGFGHHVLPFENCKNEPQNDVKNGARRHAAQNDVALNGKTQQMPAEMVAADKMTLRRNVRTDRTRVPGNTG